MTCRVCNVHLEHENCCLVVTVNNANPQDTKTPYTFGEWGYTSPVRIRLGKGDTLKFTRKGEKNCNFFALAVKETMLMRPE